MLMPDATCSNIDECASDKAVCPYNRRCVNTFGSYYCKCHVGFELKYISGRYDCVDLFTALTLLSQRPLSSLPTCSKKYGCKLSLDLCHILCPHLADAPDDTTERPLGDAQNELTMSKAQMRGAFLLPDDRSSGELSTVIPENSVKEFLKAPGTMKDRIKKLLAHKNSMKKKVKIKNIITEPVGTPAPKVNLQPFSSEESVSRDGDPSGERKRNEEGKKEGLEEERRDEKALENHVEQEQSLRGDVFSDLNISADCSFDHGVCDWKQDIEDDFDWNPADRDNAVGYYMAVPALVGQKKDVGRLKLLLPDLQPQSNFCLLFHYRLAGNKVGKLRVFVKNSNSALAWEKTRSADERWKTGKIQLDPEMDTPKSIIFEAERGKGKTGEIAVDGVLLVSGLCPGGLLSVDG
ncbi:EGF-like-domain, multiple 6 [Camelus ferus]|nr:EGF-like-domain, multiple 6 [Camelus ferus]